MDLDAAVRGELFDVAVRKTEPQIPPDRQGDDLRRNRYPTKAERGAGQRGMSVRSLGAVSSMRGLGSQCKSAHHDLGLDELLD